MIGVSRGSSAESSLKRTKRKAPPPPTSPSALLQESVSLDETLQGLPLFIFAVFVSISYQFILSLKGAVWSSVFIHLKFN